MSMSNTKAKRPLKDRKYAIKKFGVDRTRQEFLDETNINRIVSRYLKTGQFEHKQGLGLYADVSGVPDFRTALEFVEYAKNSFERLDVNLRKIFHNSPQELLEFLQDENNNEEAIKLGLKEPKNKKVITDTKVAEKVAEKGSTEPAKVTEVDK